jgi:hypothetical protein
MIRYLNPQGYNEHWGEESNSLLQQTMQVERIDYDIGGVLLHSLSGGHRIWWVSMGPVPNDTLFSM